MIRSVWERVAAVILEMRVLIAGGGTGGHLYPGIAVAETLVARHPETRIRFVGTVRGIERRVVPELGYDLSTIRARGLPRRARRDLLALVRSLADQLVGVLQSIGLVLRYRPDVVIGTGAYVSAPVVVAAKLARCPCVVLEQNRVPGRTNRLLARLADEVHLTFSESRRYFGRKDNLRLTGNPIRPGLVLRDRSPALDSFGLAAEKTTLLVFGGSRGAHRINLALVEALPLLARIRKLQLLVQTGDEDLEMVRQAVAGVPIRASVHRYLDDIALGYSVAGLVVCRAGATTLAELTACGLPSILVPYPHAADDHQRWNAEKLVQHGAAVSIADEELTGKRLARVVRRLVLSPNHLHRMAVQARILARPEAALRVAESVERLAGLGDPADVGGDTGTRVAAGDGE
ncbi:MAG: undecaprenyldiphospho-muramoylpentapeptide beta-N-acetylglucosaminyltransferase [Candidatus Eiseniibacteriota bacterium]|jgi:UDP-N-acetylglucosamine--N-acetylmuramyl-(pentapeptide) pyrophosphoryl-undecaprenol N-acetylglucosamine transferase